MDYKSLLNNIKEDSATEALHLNSRVLLVDGMNTFLRSFAVINYSNTQGTHIGGLVGFLRSMVYVINLIKPTRVICVFDGEGNTTNRKNLYSDYKGNRKIKRITNWSSFDTLEEESSSISQQLLRLIDYLKHLPVNISVIDKLEADDIIGYLAPKFNQSVILSVDKDFLQLCSNKVQVYSPIRKKFYGPKEVFDEYGLWPQNFINYKVLLGDTSDNLPGVKGLGPKKLFKLFPELTGDRKLTLKEIIQSSFDKHKDNGIYGDVYNFRKQLDINEQLMSLEDPNIPENDKIRLDKIILDKPYNFNQQRFLQLHKSDLIENKISPNIEFWLSENFNYLTKYKHK